MTKLRHCAEFDGQICVCTTIVWAMQCECSFAGKASHDNRCMYFDIETSRCDNINIAAELMGRD